MTMGALMMYDGVSCPPHVHGLPIISPYPNPSSQHADDDDYDHDEDDDDEPLCDGGGEWSQCANNVDR